MSRLSIAFVAAIAAMSFATVAAAQGLWTERSVPRPHVAALSPAAVEAVAIELRGGPTAVGQPWQLPSVSGSGPWRTVLLAGSADADFRWQGVHEADPEAQAVVVRRGNALSGLISTRDGIYELIPTGTGNYLVKLDSSRFPGCAGAVAALHDHPSLQSVPAPGAPRGSEVTIDVLVVYTPEARDAAAV